MRTQKTDLNENHLEDITLERMVEDIREREAHTHTLGSVRLHNAHTSERILVPQPSNDPNDPLNWSRGFRYYQAALVCLAMVLCNFLAAGPTCAIVETTIDYFGSAGADFVAMTAFFYTTTSLTQGLGNLIWMPLVLKYGRRPVYLASFVLYTLTAIWVGLTKTYANALVARIVMGFAAGSGECLAPLTISDIFFLHERGTVMAVYTASLNFGVSIGIIISGLITIDLSWRYIYWVATALIGLLTIIVFFTMPETSYGRTIPDRIRLSDNKCNDEKAMTTTELPTRHPYAHTLKLYHGKLTSEPFWRLFFRPVFLLILPPVFWATLVMSVTIGFLVAITSNFANAFNEVYDFEAWQSGLCFISGLIGSAVGIFFGGYFSDWLANYFTKRNHGIREPEFRLPAIIIGLVTTPLALALYGSSLEHALHWIVPTIAMGILNFSIAQTTNISLVYIVDSYRPIAGEAVVTQLAFKSAFGFLLSFYTNPWIEECGYQSAFGVMAGISTAALIFWVVFFIWGKQIRRATLEWSVVRWAVRWDLDREVGE